jgi:hypothetical protein
VLVFTKYETVSVIQIFPSRLTDVRWGYSA